MVTIDSTLPQYSSGNAHDAGYDAYMTGFLYFHSCKVLRLNLKSMLRKGSYGKVHKGRLPQGNIKYPLVLSEGDTLHQEAALRVFHVYPFDMAYSIPIGAV